MFVYSIQVQKTQPPDVDCVNTELFQQNQVIFKVPVRIPCCSRCL